MDESSRAAAGSGPAPSGGHDISTTERRRIRHVRAKKQPAARGGARCRLRGRVRREPAARAFAAAQRDTPPIVAPGPARVPECGLI
ncbi:phospho-2-dehydro-3-deoxyheptonate aldolase [Burkholderia pseudomallei]